MQSGYLEFCRLAQAFHQDIDVTYHSWDELLEETLTAMDQRERHRLADFLGRAISQSSDAELESLWHESGSEIGFRGDGHLRAFLAGVQKTLANQE